MLVAIHPVRFMWHLWMTVWTEVPQRVRSFLTRWPVPGDRFCRRNHRGLELHNRKDPEGSEIPGTGQLHDDGRRRSLPQLQPRFWDARLRWSGRKDQGTLVYVIILHLFPIAHFSIFIPHCVEITGWILGSWYFIDSLLCQILDWFQGFVYIRKMTY